MYKIYVFPILFICYIANAQQESKIKFDSGKSNEITVIQNGRDSVQKSDIDFKHGDSNKLVVNQKDSANVKSEQKGIMHWTSNFGVIIAIIVGICSLIFMPWKKIFKKGQK